MVNWLFLNLLVSLAFGQAPTVPGGAGVQPQLETEVEISQIQRFLEPFEYNADDLRDPFESRGEASPLSPGQVYGPFLPLQSNLLSDFKLKGLLWKTKIPVAVFQGPDGQEHRLKVKDYIGENFGYIAAIREKEVVIIQTIEEDDKRYSTTKVVFLE